eukprot:Lankesteria_metandrocarpae@DN10044_c0_g1_i1.p1
MEKGILAIDTTGCLTGLHGADLEANIGDLWEETGVAKWFISEDSSGRGIKGVLPANNTDGGQCVHTKLYVWTYHRGVQCSLRSFWRKKTHALVLKSAILS